MNAEELRQLALSFPGTTEGIPFNETTLVFKVVDKMFLLVSLDSVPLRYNFKAHPEEGLRLREMYPAVIPGYHSDKRHWNTVTLDESVPEKELRAWVRESYRLVRAKLPQYVQAKLAPL